MDGGDSVGIIVIEFGISQCASMVPSVDEDCDILSNRDNTR